MNSASDESDHNVPPDLNVDDENIGSKENSDQNERMVDEENTIHDDAALFGIDDLQNHDSDFSNSSDEDGSDSNSSDSDDGVTDGNQELENRVTKKKKTRGLTRLPKVGTAYTRSGGRKRRVRFDPLGRFSGKYRAEFPSFLGDLVREKVGVSVFNWKDVTKEVRDKLWEEITRYYDIDETRRKYVMNRLGILLRSFRKRLYKKHIFPNLGKPNKLAKIPRQYRTIILSQDHWNNFVMHTQSEEFTDVSRKTKQARKNSLFQHRMGRGGYAALREKLVQDQVIEKDEIPLRSLMWYKARENKAGVLEDKNVKAIADKLMEQEKQITDGEVILDPGTDAMTLVFGKENGGFLKGVGMGVTATTYFHVPRNKSSSKEQIHELKFELENGKRELAKKDEDMKVLSTKVVEQDKTMQLILAHLASQGMVIPNLQSSPNMSPPQVVQVDKNVGSKSTTDIITGNSPIQESTIPEITRSSKTIGESKTSSTNRETTPEMAKSSKKIGESKTSPTNHEKTPEIAKSSKNVVESASPATVPEKIAYKTPHPKRKDTPALAVQQNVKCSLYYPNTRNLVAYGTIYFSKEKQTVHGVPLRGDCYLVSIDTVEKAASFLPYETREHRTVLEAHKSFVSWPKILVKPEPEVILSTEKNQLENPNKRKKTYITRDGIAKQQTRRNMHKSKE